MVEKKQTKENLLIKWAEEYTTQTYGLLCTEIFLDSFAITYGLQS